MRCPSCNAINVETAAFCGQCHRSFDQSAGPLASTPIRPRHHTDPGDPHEWARARTLERIAPGLGHLRTSQPAMGVARAGITSLWLLTVVILWFGGTAGRLSSIPLIAGVMVVWITGPADVASGRTGKPPWLDLHRFVYLVIGATAAVILVGGLVILS